MVLYKRKPVIFEDDPDLDDLEDGDQLYIMRGSDEIFIDYERYLERYTFYSQPRFTDAINGKSGMTFFDAVVSENNSSGDIDKLFPDILREPILRKVQFQDIGRIDDLVSFVYDEYRNQFFQGETVTVMLDGGDVYEGVIREKATFPELRWRDGSIIRQPFARFFINIKGHKEEALLDGDHIKRGKNVFTKQNLRAFLKNSLQREAWTGAPWLVKEHLAIKHRISMQIPEHLQQANRVRQRQVSQSNTPKSANGSSNNFNAIRGRKGKNLTPKDFDIDQPVFQAQDKAASRDDKSEPPKSKYPIEDLNIRPRAEGQTRPRLRFLAPPDGSPSPIDGLVMSSVGPLLEMWNTLNVQCEIYVLDSFTLDDMIAALRYTSTSVKCALIEEIHCAVLKILVDEDGEVQAHLPESESASGYTTPAQTPVDGQDEHVEQEVSMANVGNNHKNGNGAQTAHKVHRADEMVSEDDLIEKIKERDFADGGWQTSLAGLLHRLSSDPVREQQCKAVLTELAPIDWDPTHETAMQCYAKMDINLKISALGMIVRLTLATKAVRSYLETCDKDMTETRKLKIEHQRKRKEHIAQITELEEQKKAHDAEITPNAIDEPDNTAVTNGSIDGSMLSRRNSSDGEDEDHARSLRRGNDRAMERKRKRDEELVRKERERLERAEAAKMSNEQYNRYKKVVKDLQAARKGVLDMEEQITLCDRDLREANCQRTMRLGTDRFWNRYYWFERNGMPFGGLPDSSTAHYGYANARVWVQGPDAMEKQGYIDLDKKDMDAYKQTHGCSVPQRKEREEGETRLADALQWGYYDEADQVDALLGWLDDRGKREKDLTKELTIWREDIVAQMDKLSACMAKHKSRPESEVDMDEPVARVSTRHKTYIDPDVAGQTVLKWENGAALRELGHLHSEQHPSRNRGRHPKGLAVPVQAARGHKNNPRGSR